MKKKMYSCKTKLNKYEYGNMIEQFPKKLFINSIINNLIFDIFASLLIYAFSKSIILSIIIFLIYLIYSLVYTKFRLVNIAYKQFDSLIRKHNVPLEYDIDFFQNNLIQIANDKKLSIDYDKIKTCIETDTNFYLECLDRSGILIIQKSECDLELISFIRKKFSNILINNLGEKIKFKNVQSNHENKYISKILLVLFFLNILSIFAALHGLNVMNDISNTHDESFTKNTWIAWTFLPIPIISTIIGMKYQHRELNSKKVVLSGIIVGFILVAMGCFSFIPTNETNYNRIKDYSKIVDIILPENGKLEIQDANVNYGKKRKLTFISAYYDKNEGDDLYNQISKNDKWISGNDFPNDLKEFLFSSLTLEKESYYSIYNETLDVYNELPLESGKYKIYTMKYDTNKRILYIYKYDYLY